MNGQIKPRFSWLKKIVITILTLTGIFALAKITGLLFWSWGAITLPIWAPILIVVIVILFVLAYQKISEG